jgi:hypothetical protein
MAARADPSRPKRHHYVPEVYLRAWSDGAGRVAVRRRGQPTVFLTKPVNVGVETRLYGDGAEALWRERNFNLLENEWPRVRAELQKRGSLGGSDRDLASMFMALQIVRTREHIARDTFASEPAAFTEKRPPSRETVCAFITERYGHTPAESEVEAAWALAGFQIMATPPLPLGEAFSMSMDIATTKLAPLLGGLEWRVELASEPILWASDRPVMPWRPPGPRDEFEGVGYADSDEIRMPLGPTAMLVLQRRTSSTPVHVDAHRFHAYNKDIALQCYEFAVCTPGRRGRLEDLALAPSRPPVRFNTGPGYREDPDGTRSPIGEILHMWIPLRSLEPDRLLAAGDGNDSER